MSLPYFPALDNSIYETKYIARFYETKLAKLIVVYLTKLKATSNYYGKWRKSVIVAFKPFVAKIV
jgi:hypothetical protein